MEELKQIEEEIKRQRALLQTLDISFKHSPYNKNLKEVSRKKEAILDKIEKLEQKRNQKVAL